MRSTFAVRETASLGQQIFNATVGINGLKLHYIRWSLFGIADALLTYSPTANELNSLVKNSRLTSYCNPSKLTHIKGYFEKDISSCFHQHAFIKVPIQTKAFYFWCKMFINICAYSSCKIDMRHTIFSNISSQKMLDKATEYSALIFWCALETQIFSNSWKIL